MTTKRDDYLSRLYEQEALFYEAMPISDFYSKLLFRSFFWFCVFTALYYLATAVIL